MYPTLLFISEEHDKIFIFNSSMKMRMFCLFFKLVICKMNLVANSYGGVTMIKGEPLFTPSASLTAIHTHLLHSTPSPSSVSIIQFSYTHK